jgi:TonB-dependent receptor
MMDVPLSSALRIVTGVRRERSDQAVTTFDRFQPGVGDSVAHLLDTDYLPAVNLTYALGEDTNLRAAFSRTLNRPDLRELSPFAYDTGGRSDPEEHGNPDLERARVENYDLRAEFYPSLEELVAVSGFYKSMERPIEKVMIGGTGQATKPFNAKDGTLYGIEFETRLALSRITSALGSFAANLNVTFVESESNIDVQDNVGSSKRPLTGQSPYVVNAGLFFAPAERPLSVSLLYTVFGKRLYALGQAALPDVYERPRHSLDFAASQRFGSVNVKLGLENLLDSKEEFRQGSEVTKVAESGRSVSLSLSTGS